MKPNDTETIPMAINTNQVAGPHRMVNIAILYLFFISSTLSKNGSIQNKLKMNHPNIIIATIMM